MNQPDKTAPGGKFSLGAVERVLMAASMGLLCVLTMANVLVRYFTDISFAFTEEISVALLVVMTLVGASHAFASKHHIAITFFVDRWPAIKPLAHRLAMLCSLVMFGLLAKTTAPSAAMSSRVDSTRRAPKRSRNIPSGSCASPKPRK